MANATHPDFLRAGADLSTEQLRWLAANGIASKKGERFGFYFAKGELWIEPVAATDSRVYVYAVDRDEDGDGARVVASFERLRDALRLLAGR